MTEREPATGAVCGFCAQQGSEVQEGNKRFHIDCYLLYKRLANTSRTLQDATALRDAATARRLPPEPEPTPAGPR